MDQLISLRLFAISLLLHELRIQEMDVLGRYLSATLHIIRGYPLNFHFCREIICDFHLFNLSHAKKLCLTQRSEPWRSEETSMDVPYFFRK